MSAPTVPTKPPSIPPGPASAKKYAAGEVIGGKYQLQSVLGEGGMGAVWLARNTLLDVDVAIKLIRHGIASPEASERLLQEARAAARLEHPSIVRIFDFGATTEGDPFIAMEMLRGESLGQLLGRRGRMSASEAVRTLLPVANAVCAAHAKGIVHRDLKPDNVQLTENDAGITVPKVVDFGIAKVREDGIASRSLTRAGAILGSPDYICPELARGRQDVEGKCDVWALSVMLYECVAGTMPFNGDNYNALLSSIIEDEPTPITQLAAGDEELWTVIRAGLEKDPDQRPSMRTLGERLAQWASQTGADTDVTGASLALWFTATPRDSMVSMPELGSARSRASSRPSGAATRSGTDTNRRPNRPSTTSPPVASTSPELASQRPAQAAPRSPLIGYVIAGLVAAAVSVVAVLAMRPPPPPSSTRTAPAAVAAPTVVEAAAGEPTALPLVNHADASPESAPEGSSSAQTVAVPPSASGRTAHDQDAGHIHAPGKPSATPATGNAKPGSVALPAQPNF